MVEGKQLAGMSVDTKRQGQAVLSVERLHLYNESLEHDCDSKTDEQQGP